MDESAMTTQARIDEMRRMLSEPDIFDELLAAKAPRMILEWPVARAFQFARLRLKLSQDELAERACLTQAQISRLEAGKDCLLSTWSRAYAALGFDLKLLPMTGMTEDALRERANGIRFRDHRPRSLRPHGPWFRPRQRDAGEDTPKT